MAKLKKNLIKIAALIGATSLSFGFCLERLNIQDEKLTGADSLISKFDKAIKTNQEDFYDENVIYKLPEETPMDENVSVIVTMDTKSVMDAYKEKATSLTVQEYAQTSEGRANAARIARERQTYISRLNNAGIKYTLGEKYEVLFGGFEITIKASDFDKVNKLLEADADLIVGDVYEPAVSNIVTNEVDVDKNTGIFNSSFSEYQGDGVLVAVLDTGLDYTHPAFSVSNFYTENEKFKLADISEVVAKKTEEGEVALQAAKSTPGLTGEDVYLNKKVPYAYDYGDKDPDVLPINSEHGTHVAGIIAGKDDVITGVAPNAQLAIMKVFSDTQTGAKDSWILSALQDCVLLGVDVINMSLGSGCGFTREVDTERKNDIYDTVKEAGISLIASAANSYNATMSSTKNGTNGLTSNPDSGTVGSPSTYKAALSVASVDGVETPYIIYKDDIMYFNEASMADGKQKDFVKEILDVTSARLGKTVTEYEFEYVTIPGIGRSSDYDEDKEFYEGKIVLVKRGTTSFEDKVRVAIKEKGATGIIIYNNISGTISMSVGASAGAVCSISQDEGELMAKEGTGKIKVSINQTAGPFMSDFSSWGPTSDLKIKPEITAHGGEILSAVPGFEEGKVQANGTPVGYDRLSGTSMAAPNQAGATALIRQYVKYSGEFDDRIYDEEYPEEKQVPNPVTVTELVNRLMMSTADIVKNKNGLPYAVRKQGAGLVNILKSTTTAAFITTFENGEAMDKSKLELGDDKNREGVYEMTFDIENYSSNTVTYDIGTIVQTEGVSKTYTQHGDTTVTMEGYLLDAQTFVSVVSGGTQKGTSVTIAGDATAKVTVRIELSDSAKKYLDESFAHGMYVEGFVTLDAESGTTVDLNVPLLAFYGDWTEAPILDEEYFDTHRDELNKGLNYEDKIVEDAYATRIIGKLYSDYIAYLGAYYFKQNPRDTQIPTSKEHIAVSNQEIHEGTTINAIRYVSAGLLRNVKTARYTVTDDTTGEVIFTYEQENLHKSFSSGGGLYGSAIDMGKDGFSPLDLDLKNNTKYTARLETFIDYGEYSEQKNVRNVFEFPIFIDFEAPLVTDVEYRTEYDKTTDKTKLFADISIYDNHYAMAMMLGQIVPADKNSEYRYQMESFGKYPTPVYSNFNSTSKVTVELTEYVAAMKQSTGVDFNDPSGSVQVYNNNSFIVNCYDYAMNAATYEIRLPDEVLSMYFTEEQVTLNPNEMLDLTKVLSVFPNETWVQTLDFTAEDNDPNKQVVSVVNQMLVAKDSGLATVTAIGYDKSGNKITATLKVKVLAEGEDGYYGNYTPPEVNKFTVTSYYTEKAFYSVDSEEREIGKTGDTTDFDGEYNLSMFPSESVKLLHSLDSYFPENTKVVYKVGNSKIASVDENGKITALTEGSTTVTASVLFNGKSTPFSQRISIKVKDPFTTNIFYLMSYKGLGGTVEIPNDRGITTIYSFAFTGYDYVEKDLSAGDIIDKEDPYLIKQWYIGEDTITKVIIPEGVTHIESYAFAYLTALEEVVLPSTLTHIGVSAFEGCRKLKTINLASAKFINKKAFAGCALEEVDLSSVVSIGNYTFENCKLTNVVLPKTSMSLGIGAFHKNKELVSVTIQAEQPLKIGTYAFAECSKLGVIQINAAVISAYAFRNCAKLYDVTLGWDVAVIGEFAFAGTNVSAFKFMNEKGELKDENGNPFTSNGILTLKENGALIYKGEELVLVAPKYAGKTVGSKPNTVVVDASSIATGAFAGNTRIFNVIANNTTYVGPYAFAECSNLQSAQMDKVETIDKYAFFGDEKLTQTPSLANVKEIGDYAFKNTGLKSVTLAAGTVVGDYAFAGKEYNGEAFFGSALERIEIGDNVKLGSHAFYSPLYVLTYDATGNHNSYYFDDTYKVYDKDGNVLEEYFYYYYDYSGGVKSELTQLAIGANVNIGEYAFSGHAKLETFTIEEGSIIGNYAFHSNAGLKNVDLSKIKSIGDYAFSGYRTRAYELKDNEYSYAYRREFINGEVVIIDYMYSSFAPALTSIDLTNAETIGEGAFLANASLTNVTLGENLKEISKYAFAHNDKLTNFAIPSTVEKLGDYAFFLTPLKSENTVDLSNVNSIGEGAFARTKLSSVALKDGVTLGSAAFAYCDNLTVVENMKNAKEIGALAFSYSGLTEADLTNAEKVGEFAFNQSLVTKVTFGEKLKELGDNPFAGCEIATYGKVLDNEFNGEVIGETLIPTYNISDTVMVINEVLYQKVPNGLELVSFPKAKNVTSFVVEEGTVRICANAFQGATLEDVQIASTVKAIGDKAFYECEKLSLVVFKSYDAPILEEAYDVGHATMLNIPFTGYYYGGFEGLGISKYYMWNVGASLSNFYFGANFVNYIGHTDGNIIMVKPKNGQNYGSFIFGQYFNRVVEGGNAAKQVTLNVIEMINALPTTVTLADEAAVIAARDAYNKIPEIEQKALVSNYTKLTSAESTIAYLNFKNDQTQDSDPVTPEKTDNSMKVVLWVVLGVLIVGVGVLGAVEKARNKKKVANVLPAVDENAVETVEDNNEKDKN